MSLTAAMQWLSITFRIKSEDPRSYSICTQPHSPNFIFFHFPHVSLRLCSSSGLLITLLLKVFYIYFSHYMEYSLPNILMACSFNSLSLSAKLLLIAYFLILKCKLHEGKGCFCLSPLHIHDTNTVPDIEYGLHSFGRIEGKRKGTRGGKKQKYGVTIRGKEGLRQFRDFRFFFLVT